MLILLQAANDLRTIFTGKDLTERNAEVHAVREVVSMPRARCLSVVIALAYVLVLCGFAALAQWQQINDDGFGYGANTTASLALFNNVLYAGTENTGGLFRLGNPTDPTTFWWFEVDLPIADVPDIPMPFVIGSIPSMAVFSAPSGGWPWLYVAVNLQEDVPGGAQSSFVMRSMNGLTWELASDVWRFSTHGEIHAMAVFDGWLYVTLGDTQRQHPEFLRVMRTDGREWQEAVPSGSLTLGPGDYYFGDLEVFDGYLYAGTSGLNESEDPTRTAEVWRSRNGTVWTKIGDLSSPTMAEVKSMEVFDGNLYVGTKNHAVPEERTGPELWRYDGDEWTNLSAERRQFVREAVHLGALYAYRDVLYAATGGAVYTRVYRSLDGESWEQITPAGIREHPDDDNYLTGAMAGIGEYLFLGTGYNQGAGTEVWRLAALRSDVGPSLAQHDGAAFFLHRIPGPTENISEAVFQDGALTSLGSIYDEDVARSWALTSKQPVAYGYDFMGLMIGARYLQLVYRGHDNDSIWHTRKTSDGMNWHWETPEVVEGAHTDRAPGATAHNWAGVSGPRLTVAYTDPDTGRIHFRKKEGSSWSSEYTLPDEARSSNGPEIITFDESLYVFYRGFGDDDWLYVGRKESNRASDTRWEISRLARAFTRRSTTDRAVSAVFYDGALVVAYVGHNNDYIWLRRSTDGVNWDRLGYVRGPVTNHNPDLTVVDGTLYLAFTPTGDEEICFGTLELDTENEHDTAGHIWRSLRPMHCCPGCILTILDVIMPIRSSGGY
ncbi:hypothetical protein ACFLSW_03165 [Candidatus Bipolaricaulota bacterium]